MSTPYLAFELPSYAFFLATPKSLKIDRIHEGPSTYGTSFLEGSKNGFALLLKSNGTFAKFAAHFYQVMQFLQPEVRGSKSGYDYIEIKVDFLVIDRRILEEDQGSCRKPSCCPHDA